MSRPIGAKNANLHGIKTQDIATFVRMSLYTVNVMRIYIDICMNKPKNIDDNLCRSVL